MYPKIGNMYDKIKLWMPRTRDMTDILQYLDGGSEITDIKTGESRAFGCIENLKASVYVGGISICGSLAKYLYNGSNVYPLDRHTTKQAIEKISDSLHIEVNDAKVTAMEVGANFSMKHAPTEYIRRLGEMPRMARFSIEAKSVYYKGLGRKQPKAFTFYDKDAEALTKGMEHPPIDNILRYEMRLNGRLPRQTGFNVVKASSLYDNAFYRKLVRMLQDYYFSISKSKQLKTNVMGDIKTVGDAYDAFVAQLIGTVGKDRIQRFLDELKNERVFDDRKNYTRLKAKIEAVSNKADITVSDELINELDDEIRNFGAYV